jgi:hypothetical protein
MSIFKRSDVQQGTTPETATAAGVVPPPAAPMLSMRPPGSARADGDAESPVAEKVRMAREAQQRVRERVRLAVQRARTSPSPARSLQRHAALQEAPLNPRMSRATGSFDPCAYAQAGLLNLAWSWQESGAPIRAIHAYLELLSRYPDTPAAAAAIADLVVLSEKLTNEGRFHIALAIYDQLECLG